jgi:hypothetical protein
MSEAFRIANIYALLKPHQEKFLRADIEKALLAAEKRGEERERERCAKIAENYKALPSSFYDGAEQRACLYGQEAAAGTIALAIRGS